MRGSESVLAPVYFRREISMHTLVWSTFLSKCVTAYYVRNTMYSVYSRVSLGVGCMQSCIFVWVSECVCMCVCVWERERECVCMCFLVCLCISVKQYTQCTAVYLCGWSVCLCVYLCMHESLSVYAWEYVCACVCVCVYVSVCFSVCFSILVKQADVI